MWIASTGRVHIKHFDAMLSVNDRGTEIDGDESEMSDTGCRTSWLRSRDDDRVGGLKVLA